MKTWLLLIAALAFASVAMQAQDAAGNAENGKKLWVKDNCYTCHGYDGHGGAGVKLAPKPIAVTAFMTIVRHPPKSGMPTFSAQKSGRAGNLQLGPDESGALESPIRLPHL